MATKRINRDVNTESGIVTFTFRQADGTFANPLECNVASQVPNYADMPDNVKRLLMHGANAKFGDSAASDDNETDSRASITATYEAWVAGNWSQRGDGSGGGARSSDLAEAVFRFLSIDMGNEKVTREAVVERVSGASKDEKAEWRKDARVKVHLETIRDEKAKERKKAAKEAAKSVTGGLAGLDF